MCQKKENKRFGKIYESAVIFNAPLNYDFKGKKLDMKNGTTHQMMTILH